MPLKSLPELRQALVQRLQKRKKQKRAPESNDAETSPQINLLENIKFTQHKLTRKYTPNVVYRTLILVILVFFSVLWVVDRGVAQRVASLQEQLTESAEAVKRYSEVEDQAINLAQKIKAYKNMSLARDPFSDKFEAILNPLASMEVMDLTSASGTFRLTARSKDLFSISTVINTYVNGTVLDYIVLETASLDLETQEVTFSIRGAFR